MGNVYAVNNVVFVREYIHIHMSTYDDCVYERLTVYSTLCPATGASPLELVLAHPLIW